MTKRQYLEELDSHLINLSDEERKMAVDFYNEYFNEAGRDNETVVMAELGSPFQLAKSIIGETASFSQSIGYIKYRESQKLIEAYKASGNPNSNTNSGVQVFAGGNAADNEPDIMPNGSPYGKYNIQTDPVPPSSYNNQNTAYQTYTEPDVMPNRSDSYKNDPKNYSNYAPPKKKTAIDIIMYILFFIFILLPIVIPFALAIYLFMGSLLVASVIGEISGVVMLVVGVIRLITDGVADGLFTMGAGVALMGGSIIVFVPSLLFFKELTPKAYKHFFGNKKKGEVSV